VIGREHQADVLRDASFDAMEVGETLGPVRLVVDDHMIKWCAFTADDYLPWAVTGEGSPFGGRVGHAAILVPDLLRLLNTKFDPDTEAGLHQKEEVWFHSPVHLGEEVELRAEFVDKYTKRGKGYIVTEGEARAVGDGRLIVTKRSTEIARVEPDVELGSRSAPELSRKVTGEWPTDRAVATNITASIAAGTPVQGPVKHVHQDQMSVFSNVQSFWRNIHTDLDAAHAAGFDSTLAQGLMETMYLSQLGTAIFGAPWFTSGWLQTIFVGPVRPNDQLQTRAVVTSIEPGAESGARVELEAWIENQAAEKTAVGWMSALAAA
jgi:acyl dehydratase